MSSDGSKVTVNPYSAVRYESAGVNVVKGTAAVSTTDGLPAQAAQVTVTPRTRLRPTRSRASNNNVVITSKTGALMVTDAGKTTEMDAGTSSSVPAAAAPAPAPAPPAPQGFPVFPGSGLTTKQVLTISAVVAGAVAITALWAGMSPSQVAPLGAAQTFSGRSQVAHMGVGMARVVQVARIAATPVMNGVSNSARAGAQARTAAVQHRTSARDANQRSSGRITVQKTRQETGLLFFR